MRAPGPLLREANFAAAARPIKHAQAFPILERLRQHGPRHAQLRHAVLNVLKWDQSARPRGSRLEDVEHHVKRIAACHIRGIRWRRGRRCGARAVGASARGALPLRGA